MKRGRERKKETKNKQKKKKVIGREYIKNIN